MSRAARRFGVPLDELRQMRDHTPEFSNEDIYNGGRSRMICELLEKNISLSMQRIAQKLGCSLATAERQLYRMRDAGEVVRQLRGKKEQMRWRLAP